MKTSLPIISFLLLIVSLFGLFRAYNLPTERLVIQEVTLLDYQHQGKFDYLVYLKPSHLYGPEPQEPPPPPPELMKYPVAIVDRFNLTFSYSLVPDRPVAKTSEEVEVRAIVKSPGAKEDNEIILIPRTSKTGDFTVTFPLDISDNVSDSQIAVSDNISGSEITITAYVYATFETEAGPVFESFTQSLPMRARGPLIEVAGDLSQTSPGHIGELNYEQHGEFNYEVRLRTDSPFGPVILKPPSVISPTPVSPQAMSPENTIISGLVDSVNMSFSYHLESSKPIKKLDEAVTIEAVLESPGKWSKTIELVPLTNKNEDFTVTFPLDLEQLSVLFDNIQQETATSASARNLAIEAKVRVLADTDFGTIDENFTQSVSTDLNEDVIAWSDNLTKSEPGSFKTTDIVPRTEKLLGLPVSQTRILLAVITGIILVLFAFSLLWYFWRRQAKLTTTEKEAQQAHKKYKNIIVEIKDLPEVKPGETVILLNSLDDLIRTAEGLLKPVLHKAEGQRHIYCVFDAATRYEHQIG
jgi:hypothetical protein